MQRLHGVDHAYLRSLLIQGGEHGGEIRLGDDRHREGIAAPQAFGAQPDLRRGLLGGDVEGPPAGGAQVAERHRGERRLADARSAADENEGSGDQATAEHAVQLADTGRQALVLLGTDVTQSDRGERPTSGPTPRIRTCARSTPATCGGGTGLLGHRVPFAAVRTAPGPATRLVRAGGADEHRG